MKTLFSTIDRLENAMSFHRDRHAVLAGNVANVDTPGYRPFDLERVETPEGPMSLARTNEGHLPGPETEGVALSFDDAGQTQGADGNAVSLERELAKMDANRVRYLTATELTSRKVALLRYAATDGNG
jgi:flagellar basal-body rod protein FlgB